MFVFVPSFRYFLYFVSFFAFIVLLFFFACLPFRVCTRYRGGRTSTIIFVPGTCLFPSIERRLFLGCFRDRGLHRFQGNKLLMMWEHHQPVGSVERVWCFTRNTIRNLVYNTWTKWIRHGVLKESSFHPLVGDFRDCCRVQYTSSTSFTTTERSWLDTEC